MLHTWQSGLSSQLFGFQNSVSMSDPCQATNQCGAFTWATSLETKAGALTAGWRLTFLENSSSFAPYKEQGKGLKGCAHPPTASVPGEGGSTPSVAHQWSQFLSEEKEED